MQTSLFAAGFAGIAVGAKLSWSQLVDRFRVGDSIDRDGVSASDEPVASGTADRG